MPNKNGVSEPRIIWTKDKKDAAPFSSEDSAADFLDKHLMVLVEMAKPKVMPK